MALRGWATTIFFFNLLMSTAAGHNLATITPCPDCDHSIAPKLVTVTAQYQTVPTCKPSTTTEVLSYTKQNYGSAVVETVTKTKTVPSCKSYAWVSTTIPAYLNGTRTSSVVTTTNQPVTFSSLHYTETHTTTVTLPQRPKWNYGHHNSTRNDTHPVTTTKLSYTTIDVKDYCDYNSIGPIAIGGYDGSGLCTDCGPDASSALTQRLTVVSCANKHCTTFNETWIARPQTYSSDGATHTMTTTNTYCPTATPTSAIPGYTNTAPTATHTGAPSSSPYPTGDTNSSSAGGYPDSHSSATSRASSSRDSSTAASLTGANQSSAAGGYPDSHSSTTSQASGYPDSSSIASPTGETHSSSVGGYPDSHSSATSQASSSRDSSTAASLTGDNQSSAAGGYPDSHSSTTSQASGYPDSSSTASPTGETHSSLVGGYPDSYSSSSSQAPDYPGTSTAPYYSGTTPPTTTPAHTRYTSTTTGTDSKSEHSTPTGYPTHTTTYSEPEPEPTSDYPGEPDTPVDPSGDMGYDDPAPTVYHPSPEHYKLFRKSGIEKPRGRVMKRSGLLFWAD